MTAIDDFFKGKHFNSDETGDSFKTYLDFLDVIKNLLLQNPQLNLLMIILPFS